MDDGLTRYTPINAIPELREAISAKFKRDNGLDYSVDEIAVGCGGKQVAHVMGNPSKQAKEKAPRF